MNVRSDAGSSLESEPMTPSGIVVRTWNDAPISRRDSDGFANATAMCQANGKLWGHYHRLDTTAAYIKALGDSLGIPSDQLVISTKGGPSHLQGTWIHPRLAVDLARWLSPEFAVWMDGWFLEQSEAQHHQQPQGLTAEQVLHLIQQAIPSPARSSTARPLSVQPRYTAKQAIFSVLSDARTNGQGRIKRSKLLADVSRRYGHSWRTIDNTLAGMVRDGLVHRGARGLYSLYPWNEVVDIWNAQATVARLREQVQGLSHAVDSLGQTMQPQAQLHVIQPSIQLLPGDPAPADPNG